MTLSKEKLYRIVTPDGKVFQAQFELDYTDGWYCFWNGWDYFCVPHDAKITEIGPA